MGVLGDERRGRRPRLRTGARSPRARPRAPGCASARRASRSAASSSRRVDERSDGGARDGAPVGSEVPLRDAQDPLGSRRRASEQPARVLQHSLAVAGIGGHPVDDHDQRQPSLGDAAQHIPGHTVGIARRGRHEQAQVRSLEERVGERAVVVLHGVDVGRVHEHEALPGTRRDEAQALAGQRREGCRRVAAGAAVSPASPRRPRRAWSAAARPAPTPGPRRACWRGSTCPSRSVPGAPRATAHRGRGHVARGTPRHARAARVPGPAPPAPPQDRAARRGRGRVPVRVPRPRAQVRVARSARRSTRSVRTCASGAASAMPPVSGRTAQDHA